MKTKLLISLIIIFLTILLIYKNQQKQKPIVAAHYYSWFPENWQAGFIGEKTIPKILPQLGVYDSDETTFKQHLQWAKNAGINLIIFDYWIKRQGLRKKVQQFAKILESDSNMNFAIHYEVFDLKNKGDSEVTGETGNVIYINNERKERLKQHFEHLARKFMSNPRYFKIDNKPVLFIYVTRHMVGDLASAVKEAREHIKKLYGLELYLVADEVYYNVLDYNEQNGVILKPTLTPDLDRIKAFDALTCYNPYLSDKKDHAGEKGVDNFFNDVDQLYSTYYNVAKSHGMDFFPGILAGYNDRGVRLKEDHFVIPHYYQNKQGEEKSFFVENLNRLAKKYTTSKNPLFVITSWNEWNEGTQIEPSTESPETTNDSSGNNDYTQGERHRGYGSKHLQELKDFIDTW